MTTADEHVELVELYARYTHAYDEGRADDLADLFTADGEFVRPGADPVRGRVDLAEMVRGSAARGTGNRHLVSAVVIEAGPDGTATGQAYVQVVSGPSVIVMGRYDDDFAKEHGRWRIRSRRFTPFGPTPQARS
jgi:ketosteroid isomerase-like protein